MSPAARDAVEQTIARTGYRPNRAARRLVTRRTGSIGLVVCEPDGRGFSDPFFASVVHGVTDVVRDRDIQLVLVLANDGRAHRQVLDYLRGGHLDGALLISSHARDPLPAMPALTTVHQPVERMARTLTLTLLDRIANPDSPVTARVYPPRLVVRESSGPAAVL